jgi:hypothetical protein
MQKVVGSSPIIRSSESPAQAGFFVRRATPAELAGSDSQPLVSLRSLNGPPEVPRALSTDAGCGGSRSASYRRSPGGGASRPFGLFGVWMPGVEGLATIVPFGLGFGPPRSSGFITTRIGPRSVNPARPIVRAGSPMSCGSDRPLLSLSRCRSVFSGQLLEVFVESDRLSPLVEFRF